MCAFIVSILQRDMFDDKIGISKAVCADERVAVAVLTSGHVLNTDGDGLNCLLDAIRKLASKKDIRLFDRPVAGDFFV